jgi:hypothetical protein
MGVMFIEETLLDSVRKLLTGRVNELLGEMEWPVPLVAFGQSLSGAYAVTPVLRLAACERSEKERVIRMDAYTLTVGFVVPERLEAERNCYAYSWAVDTALGEDTTLGGVADRAAVTGKTYDVPKHEHCGEGWGAVITLRLSVESLGVR